MAEYLILIYEDEGSYAGADEQVLGEVMQAHQQFGIKHEKALRGGNALQPTETATSIRKDALGHITVTDGAFAESKEALGGYYLIEAAEREAQHLDRPARFGGVEVRPIMVFD